jgi:hypothetical protein
MTQYQSSACLQDRHLDCRDAACRCWRCGCQEQRTADARAASDKLIAEHALRAATVTYHCQEPDCNEVVPEGFILCDTCHERYAAHASPYERAEHRRERGRELPS